MLMFILYHAVFNTYFITKARLKHKLIIFNIIYLCINHHYYSRLSPMFDCKNNSTCPNGYYCTSKGSCLPCIDICGRDNKNQTSGACDYECPGCTLIYKTLLMITLMYYCFKNIDKAKGLKYVYDNGVIL